MPIVRMFDQGSSPLARGLLVGGDAAAREYGIIPARAGFTLCGASDYEACEDHPRSRGVYRIAFRIFTLSAGSSPLARGLLAAEPGEVLPRRIIPARAGFTTQEYYRDTRREDHPRSRGVYRVCRRPSDRTMGSSPLARGLRPVEHFH